MRYPPRLTPLLIFFEHMFELVPDLPSGLRRLEYRSGTPLLIAHHITDWLLVE